MEHWKTRFERDHLENSIHQDRACWGLWQMFCTKHRKWRVNNEMEGWMMKGSLELLPFADDDDSDECSDE